jgi:hypothetical protein
VHPVQLGLHDRAVLGAVGGDGAPVVGEEGDRLVVEIDRAGGPAVVEDAGAEDQLADEVGSLQRGQQRHGCPVAVAQQGGQAADDLLEEGDGVLGHELVGDGAFDVGVRP